MQCKIRTSKKKNSRKEKTITRYTRIYIKTKWQG